MSERKNPMRWRYIHRATQTPPGVVYKFKQCAPAMIDGRCPYCGALVARDHCPCRPVAPPKGWLHRIQSDDLE